MNTDELELALFEAERKVLKVQTKLHGWARDDPHRRFDDLSISSPTPRSFWSCGIGYGGTGGNKGARTAGGRPHCGVHRAGDRRRGVPRRAAGLAEGPQLPATAGARADDPQGEWQAAWSGHRHHHRQGGPGELVLKPIFESDFLPCSYGFRPNHRAHDAVAEVRHFTSHSYEWIVEGDIKACFDEISHSGLLARVRDRVGDKRVLTLVPIDPEDLTSPRQEAGASALAFIVGAVRPLLAILLPPPAWARRSSPPGVAGQMPHRYPSGYFWPVPSA